MWFLTHAWIVPALPALGFVLILLFGKKLLGPNRAHWIGIPLIVAAFVLSICTGIAWIQHTNQDVHSETASLAHVDPGCSHEAARAGAEVAHGSEATSSESTASSSESAASSSGEQSGEQESLTAPVVRCLTWFDSGPAK